MADDNDVPDVVFLAGMVDNAAPEDIIAKPVRAGKVGRLAGFAALAHVLEARRKAALATGDEFIAERGESRHLLVQGVAFDEGRELIVDLRNLAALVQRLHHLQQRSEEHTSELQSLMRISYAVFCL